MKKLLAFILVGMSISAGAQYQWDYGLKLGAANYLGDIGGKELPRRDFVWDMHLPQTRYAVGFYGRYKMSKRLSLSLQADHVLIQDADANTTYVPRRARNLNFRNRMFEVGARAEFTIWYDNDVGNRGYYNPDFKLYVFGGVSGFYTNPQAKLVYDGDTLTANPNNVPVGDFVDNTWYNLRQLRTEGVRYSAFGVAIPLGIGLYFTFNKEWRVGWEFSWRTTFTDYLDDVSTVYSDVDPESRENTALAQDLQSQTYQKLIDEQNLLVSDGQGTMSINDFQQQPSTSIESIRGYQDQNDSYMTTQVTIGKVIRGRSKFYKSKYSWVGRRSVRKTKAKF
jgi:hypothetical protein